MRNLFQDVARIEIASPEQLDVPRFGQRNLMIDDPQIVRRIISALKLIKSDQEAISGCKVPPGFRVRFFLPQDVIDADITITGHKHIVLWMKTGGENIHYELPYAFEKEIRPYLLKALERFGDENAQLSNQENTG